MKVKVLHREEPQSGGVQRYERNKDPQLHPLERAREYQRALNAVKMQKMFAKPFICALDGHSDAVKTLCKTKSALAPLFSGSADGEVKLWNLAERRLVRSVRAHQGFVRGICTGHDDRFLFTCGDDKMIKQWSVREFQNDASDEPLEPSKTFHAATMLTSIDHHWKQSYIATSGETVDIWDHHRSAPLHSFEWGCDYVMSVRFNPAEPCLIGSTGADNSIGLYDLRASSAIRKVIMKMRSNALCWSPREPVSFTVANEDCKLYTYDMRYLDFARTVHQDHVMAVLDVDYSPCGTKFVSASYDKTCRIWARDKHHSTDVYHGMRMQRVLATKFSSDGRFIFTGSEDTNVRCWKAKAAEKLGVKDQREKVSLAYREKLVEKFKELPEIRRIHKHKHVPKMIKSLTNKRRIMEGAKKKREENQRRNTKLNKLPYTPLGRKPVVKQVE